MYTLDEILAAAELIAIEKEISQKWTTIDGPSTTKACTGEPYVTVATGFTDDPEDRWDPMAAVTAWKTAFDQFSTPYAARSKLYWRVRPLLEKVIPGGYHRVYSRLVITSLPEDPDTVEEIKHCTPQTRADWRPLPAVSIPAISKRETAEDIRHIREILDAVEHRLALKTGRTV